MKGVLRLCVLIKQVPDQSSTQGLNTDGTIDRARARSMLNPFDRFAIQAALDLKRRQPATITAISMGPEAAVEVLLEALEHGVDDGVLLSDKRLAGSDTLATAYALAKTIEKFGPFDLIFAGLQTTDGDTAQVGPQIAERLNLPQITYCDQFEIVENKLRARRIIEGGRQSVISQMPALLTITNTYHPLEYKSFRGAWRVQQLLRQPEKLAQTIRKVDVDAIGADAERCGLKGSPTIVAQVEKVEESTRKCRLLVGNAETTVALLRQESDIDRFLVPVKPDIQPVAVCR